MYDRQPTPGKEGRVLITPLNGSAPYYATVAMADEPLEEGTALNKANLLKDATAALFGLGADAVPDDVLKVIRSVLDIKTEMEIVSYTGTGTYGSENPTSVTFSGAPIVVIALGWLTNDETPYWSTRTGEDDYISMLPMSVVSTDYTPGRGFGNDVNSGVYGKKSEDGKTFSWYNEYYAGFQLNAEGYTYFILALYDGGTGSIGEGDTGGSGDTGDSGGSDTGGGSGSTDTPVTFTIDGGDQDTVMAGTTWANYIASMGNVSLYLKGGYVCYNMGTSTLVWLYDPSGKPAKSTDAIVSGDYYTGPATVTFTVDGGAERTVEKGTTWEEYITSLGEGTKLYIDGGYVYYDPEAEVPVQLSSPSGTAVGAADVIVSGDYTTD